MFQLLGEFIADGPESPGGHMWQSSIVNFG